MVGYEEVFLDDLGDAELHNEIGRLESELKLFHDELQERREFRLRNKRTALMTCGVTKIDADSTVMCEMWDTEIQRHQVQTTPA